MLAGSGAIKRRISIEEVRFFLHLGYFPSSTLDLRPIDFGLVPSPIAHPEGDEKALVASARQVMVSVMSQSYKSGSDIVVPLSGGLDSRAILAALLDVCEPQRITTITYGTPGTLDFELGRLVAGRAGVKHEAFDLVACPSNLDDLVNTAKRFHLQTALFQHPNMREFDSRLKGAQIWSGYVGDAIVGSRATPNPSHSLEEAKLRYSKSRRYSKTFDLSRRTPEEIASLITVEERYGEFLNYDEQLIFLEAAPKYVAPHLLYTGYEYITPFINSELMVFFLLLPKEHRISQSLYYKMLFQCYSTLFELPSTAKYGGRYSEAALLTRLRKLDVRARNYLRRKYPSLPLSSCIMTKYIDFGRAARRGGVYHQIFESCIRDLAARDLIAWVDIRNLWQRHQSGEINVGTDLQLLVSLEILLKAGVTVQ